MTSAVCRFPTLDIHRGTGEWHCITKEPGLIHSHSCSSLQAWIAHYETILCGSPENNHMALGTQRTKWYR